MSRALRMQGQVTAEFLVGAAIVLALIVGTALHPSVMSTLVDAVHRGFARFSNALSLP